MKKNTINKLIAGALVFGSVLSINTFSANAAQKGWVNLDGCWKYYDESGNEVKGKTITIQDKEFSFDNNGILIADQGEEIEADSFEEGGFEEDDVYYSSKEAKEASLKYNAKYPLTNECSEDYKKKDDRWANKEGKWYFNNNKYKDEGRIIDSWYKINGFWYHFNADGAMDKDTTIKDVKGNDCILNSDGVLTNRKEPDLGDEYEIKRSEIKTGWILDESTKKWNYYNQNGVKQTNKTIIEDGKKYVLDADGAWIK